MFASEIECTEYNRQNSQRKAEGGTMKPEPTPPRFPKFVLELPATLFNRARSRMRGHFPVAILVHQRQLQEMRAPQSTASALLTRLSRFLAPHLNRAPSPPRFLWGRRWRSRMRGHFPVAILLHERQLPKMRGHGHVCPNQRPPHPPSAPSPPEKARGEKALDTKGSRALKGFEQYGLAHVASCSSLLVHSSNLHPSAFIPHPSET